MDHDRSLIRNLSTRIVEIDLGKVRSFRCDYDTYLSRKSDLLDADLKNQQPSTRSFPKRKLGCDRESKLEGAGTKGE